jgi:KDO2-lipid IV(A) lauroyltransferase
VSRLLGVVASAVARLSWEGLERAGAALGWLFGSVLRVRRGAVERAMLRAGIAEPAREARAMYGALGTGVLELLWLAGSSAARRDAARRAWVAFDDDLARALRAACARGPVVLVASHTGNWELVAYAAAALLAGYDRRLAVVVKAQSVGVFDRFCTDLREAGGLTLVAPLGALGEAKRRLAGGHVVAMPIDQVPDRARHGLPLAFLGSRAMVDRAPAALARSARATLIVAAATREGRRQRVQLLAELPAEAQRDRSASAWIAEATREATASLEAFVRRHPSAWLWLHRRWRAPREAPPALGAAGAGSLVAPRHPG